jgi:hypothetical protein
MIFNNNNRNKYYIFTAAENMFTLKHSFMFSVPFKNHIIKLNVKFKINPLFVINYYNKSIFIS